MIYNIMEKRTFSITDIDLRQNKVKFIHQTTYVIIHYYYLLLVFTR